MRSWLEEVAEATKKEALAALKRKEPWKAVSMGASGAPTSALDAAAEKVIIDALKDAPVPLNLATEEAGIVYNGAEWWLISDPVDGTRNALRNLPFHCVSLAIGQNDLSGVEMGIVHSIPSKETWWAEKGKGATRDGQKVKARKLRTEEILLSAALDYEKRLIWPKTSHVHVRDLGSAALEMCYVAAGAFDGFYSTQPLLRVVDIAASTLIVREAGGVVLDWNGDDLRVPFDVRKKFPMVALGDRHALGVFRR